MKKVLAAALAVSLAAIVLTGCSAQPKTADPAHTNSSAPAPKDPSTFAFGATKTWTDGTAISVSAPSAFQATPQAAGAVAGEPQVVFTITYTNGTNEATSAFVEMSVKGASNISDLDNPIGDALGFPPTKTLKPGQSASWLQAYSVPDPTAITLTVGPGFGATPVTFTNTK